MPSNLSRAVRFAVWAALCLGAPWPRMLPDAVAQGLASPEPSRVAQPLSPGASTPPAAAAPADVSPGPPFVGDYLVDDGPTGAPSAGWGFSSNTIEYLPPFEPWVNVTGRLMWLHRTEANRAQPIVTAATATDTITAISTDNLNLPTEAGVRASVLLGPHRDRFIELAYLGVFDQEAQASVAIDPAATGVVSTTQLFFGAAATSFTNFAYTSVYESDLHSPELNFWLSDNDWRFRPMLGVRWIEQSDDFRVYETAAPGNGGVAELTNDLVGGQFGFQSVLYQRAEWFYVQAVCKAGLYHNRVDLRASVYTGGVPQAAIDRQTGATSFSGEINVTAIWRITPHLNFHVGYTGLWLTNVGLAGDQNDQFDVLAGTGTFDLGGISYQGGHLGATLTW